MIKKTLIRVKNSEQ